MKEKYMKENETGEEIVWKVEATRSPSSGNEIWISTFHAPPAAGGI